MSAYQPGEVVFLDFPFSTLGTSKRRPALVLLDAGHGDTVLARITSSRSRHASDVALSDWATEGLLAASWVRLSKLLTIADTLILRSFGTLTPTDRATVGDALRHMFDADWPPP